MVYFIEMKYDKSLEVNMERLKNVLKEYGI